MPVTNFSQRRQWVRRDTVLVVIAVLIITVLFSLALGMHFDGDEGPAWLSFVGRFHIVVLHLPFGCLLLVPVLEWLGRSSPAIKSAVMPVLLLGTISAVLAASLGLSLAYSEGYSGSVVENHMWMGVAASCSAILALVALDLIDVIPAISRIAYPLTMVTCLLALIVGGHLGGTLVQGPGYLSDRLPNPVKEFLGLPIKRKIVLSYASNIYDDLIQPLLDDHCYACHNEWKSKGKYNMASFEGLLRGGKGGDPAIVPGSHLDSELIQRINLARRDKDAMPPDKREPLAPSDKVLLAWWIDIGAPANRHFDELSQQEYPAEISNIVDALIAEARVDWEGPEFDPEFVLGLSGELKFRFGIDLLPVSQSVKDGLNVVAINSGQAFGVAVLEALLPVAESIRSMEIGGAVFEPGEFADISRFVNLQRLRLDAARIPSTDLIHLADLKLESLNLFATMLDKRAVEHLSDLKTLNHLYLGETGLTTVQISELKLALTRTEIVSAFQSIH